jgi:hypothetical protein
MKVKFYFWNNYFQSPDAMQFIFDFIPTASFGFGSTVVPFRNPLTNEYSSVREREFWGTLGWGVWAWEVSVTFFPRSVTGGK